MGSHLFPFRTEVKPIHADGTAFSCGRVGSRLFKRRFTIGAFFVFCPLVADSGFNGAFLCLFFLCRRTFLFSAGHSECPLTGAHFSLRYWCWFGHSIADAVPEGSIPNREDKSIRSASKTRHTLFVFFRPHRSEAIYYPEKAVLFFRELMLVRMFDCRCSSRRVDSNREDKSIRSASKTRHTLFVFFRPHRSEAIYYPEKAVLFFRELMLVRMFDCRCSSRRVDSEPRR